MEARPCSQVRSVHGPVPPDWLSEAQYRGNMDGTPDVVGFAETLEKVCVDVVESGRMTKDLAILIRPDHPYLSTEAFMDAIDAELKLRLGSMLFT